MEQFKMTPNSAVKLTVSISSAAIVGSNVSINDKIIKKSIAYKFTTQLGNSEDLRGKFLTSFSNFSTHKERSNKISDGTKVIYTMRDAEKTEKYEGTLIKIADDAYTIYLALELI